MTLNYLITNKCDRSGAVNIFNIYSTYCRVFRILLKWRGFTDSNIQLKLFIKIYNISRIFSENFNLIPVVDSEIQPFKIARSRLPAWSLKTLNVFLKTMFPSRLSRFLESYLTDLDKILNMSSRYNLQGFWQDFSNLSNLYILYSATFRRYSSVSSSNYILEISRFQNVQKYQM